MPKVLTCVDRSKAYNPTPVLVHCRSLEAANAAEQVTLYVIAHLHIHTHIYTHIYIYISICI